jgi:chaperone protein PapD
MKRQDCIMKKRLLAAAIGACGLMALAPGYGAISLDRTRVIFNGDSKSVSLNISNENTQLPYLAQGWIEDASGAKITSPLIVLPPVQRVDPGAKSQLKIQALPATAQLAQDRETLYWFNLREIPPRSEKPNTLQIALQTRIKMFYRPASIVPTKAELANPWQEKLTLERKGDSYQVNNPTPYFVTLVDAGSRKDQSASGFKPVMVEPFGNARLGVSAAALGSAPVITYINDYGGRPTLTFRCAGAACQVEKSQR